jgi:amyloid beta precursor protein binding protein 1
MADATVADGTAVPDTKTRRYDRQLRLWAASGQAALEQSRILLLSASATSTSILKNLVLPGIGHFTVLDHSSVTPQDAGNNFFLDGPASIGKSRAAEAVRLLAELNEGVDGKADARSFREIVLLEAAAGEGESESESEENSSVKEWLGGYTIVIAHNLEKDLVERLAGVLWADESLPPLVVVRSAGFLAEFAIQFHEHTVIESHLETSPTLRIDNAFPALKEYALSLDLDDMDVTDHGHIPYVVLLVRALEDWKKAHNNLPPQSYADKQSFKSRISSMRRKPDEENIEEAESQAYRCWTSSSVPSEISALFSDDRLSEPSTSTTTSTTSSLPPFFQLLKALRSFTEKHGYLPLTSTLPDMKASTEEYVRLQTLYKNQAEEEKAEVKEILREQGGGGGDVDDALLDSFVRNAHRLKVLEGRKWGASDGLIANAIETSPKQAATHLGLSALETVLLKKGYSTLHSTPPAPQITAEELTEAAQALLPPGVSLPETEWDCVAGEIARAPTADLPNTAALLGGLVAQEVIKMITKQYVPINGCCVVDLIETWTGVI